MMHRILITITLLAACSAQPSAQPPVDTGRTGAADSAALRPPLAADSIARPRVPLVPTPEPVRGLYVNRWAAIGTKIFRLIDVAKATEVNALVIDVKDDRGFLLYPSEVALAREIGADARTPEIMPMTRARMRAILDTMRAHGIYPVARIVVVKDPILAKKRTQWAIKRKSDGQPWLDKSGNPWLDPHHTGVWDYAADLAEEAVELGFSEIQLDYVRFPDERRILREAQFPLAQGRSRADVIGQQIGRLRQRLKHLAVPLTIDVFGLTTSDSTDMGIGQRWEAFIDQADVVLPMTYPSHYHAGSYKIARPNANPYAVIDNAMKDAKRRSAGIAGAAKVIPWYQDFTLGAPRYGVAEVRAQMKAGYDNGIYDWILWNPSSNYTVAALRDSATFVAEVIAIRARADSATAVADSVARRDSLARADSLARRDTTARDSTARDSTARPDSTTGGRGAPPRPGSVPPPVGLR
jgi:hypothetical protein